MSLLDFRKLSKLEGGRGQNPSWAVGLKLDPGIPALPFESVLIYAVVYPSAKAAPSKDQIVAGLDVDNTAAVWSGYASAPISTGTEVFNWPAVVSGLTAATSYRAAFVRIVNGNASNVAVSDVWTTSGGGVSGTSGTTNANDTSSASGTTTVVGTLARTNANDTSSASGTTTVVGTSATTNADDTSSASGTVGGGAGVSGTSATTNADDTSSASGTTTVVGTSASTNADDAGSASGTTTVVGTSATTNANDTAAASGWAGTVSGSSATTNANDIADALGTSGSGPVTGHGFEMVNHKPSRRLWWLRKPKAIDEEEAEEALEKAAEVIVSKVAEQVAKKADPKTAKKAVKEAVRPVSEKMPGFDWRAFYEDAMRAGQKAVNQQELTQAAIKAEIVYELIKKERARTEDDDLVEILAMML